MRLLITGATGMLGHAIQRLAQRLAGGVDWRVAAFSRKDLDVTNVGAIQSALSMVSPNVVINCAASTNVDGCETEPEVAYRMNGEVPGLLAKECEVANALLVHFSTDYVFDGRSSTPYKEDQPVAPLSIYGRSKLAGEDAIRSINTPHLILRTQWLYGRHGHNFIDTIIRSAASGEKLRVVNDQFGAPTYAIDLATATLEAIAAKLTGTYHAVSAGKSTWYDLARKALAFADLDPELVSPTTTAEFPRPAQRPAWGVLDTSKLAGAGITLRPWEEALEQYVLHDRKAAPGEEKGSKK